jgi:hypothetical protein
LDVKHATSVLELAATLQHRALRIGSHIVMSKGRGIPSISIRGALSHEKLTAFSWMSISFDEQHIGGKALARRFNVSPPTIRNSIILMAGVAMNLSHRLAFRLEQAAMYAPRMGIQLRFVIANICWDETSRLLTMPIASFASTQRRSSWHVLVSQLFVDVVWESRGSYRKHSCTLARPNVPLFSITAECIADGLFNVAAVAKHWSAIRSLFACSTLSCFHCSKDGAASNLRLTAAKFKELAEQFPKLLMSELDCGLHHNHLVKGIVLKRFMPLVTKLYSISSLCRMGSSFLRLLHAVPHAVHCSLEMRQGPPPNSALQQSFGQQLLSYVKFHGAPLHKTDKPTRGRLSNAGAQLVKSWSPVLEILNCEWSESVMADYCQHSDCCKEIAKKQCVGKLTKALLSSIYLAKRAALNWAIITYDIPVHVYPNRFS